MVSEFRTPLYSICSQVFKYFGHFSVYPHFLFLVKNEYILKCTINKPIPFRMIVCFNALARTYKPTIHLHTRPKKKQLLMSDTVQQGKKRKRKKSADQ